MPASQSGVFSVQQFTDAGLPLIGGRLYTYAFGTTTQKTAYTDAAGSISHTYTSDGLGGQYLALNARGELPAPLYLVAGAYDITLKRADGSSVWTRRADPTSADLGAPGGAALVGFQPEGTGAIATTVQAQLRDMARNIKDFGSVGNGVADDAVALLALVNSGSKYIYLETGKTYYTSQAIPIPDGVEHFGGNGSKIVYNRVQTSLVVSSLFYSGFPRVSGDRPPAHQQRQRLAVVPPRERG